MTDANKYYLDKREAEQEEYDFKDEYEEIAADNMRLEAKLAKAVECFAPCITLLDGLVEESKRIIEWGEEDTFRMGEWFERGDLERIEKARKLIAELKGEQDE